MIRVVLVILIVMSVDQLSFNNSTRNLLYNHIMQGIGADCQRTNPQVVTTSSLIAKRVIASHNNNNDLDKVQICLKVVKIKAKMKFLSICLNHHC